MNKSWQFRSCLSRKPTYIIPRKNQTIVGGTALPPEEITDAAISQIRVRAAEILPGLTNAPEPQIVAANRPYRPTVRLEKISADGKMVVYNYGHGGAGITLSWGCAAEVGVLLSAQIGL